MPVALLISLISAFAANFLTLAIICAHRAKECRAIIFSVSVMMLISSIIGGWGNIGPMTVFAAVLTANLLTWVVIYFFFRHPNNDMAAMTICIVMLVALVVALNYATHPHSYPTP